MEDVVVHPECPFSVNTFDLLEKLHKNSNKRFYIEQKEKFNQYVEIPLQKLCNQVEPKLRNQIRNYMEFDFRSLPNKFVDQGFFYTLQPKMTDTKSTGTNFFITIVASDFRFGLFIKHSSLDKQNFIQNFKKKSVKEVILQHTNLPHKCELHSSSKTSLDRVNLLADWFRILARQNSTTKNIQASTHLKPSQVLLYSSEQLGTHIKQAIEGLFPLFLMATYKDPIPVIIDYLNSYDKYESELRFNRGIINYQQAKYQESIREFDYALDKAYGLADTYNYRGQAKAELGDLDGAIWDYNQLLLIQPKNAEAYNNRGNACYKLKDYEAAIKDYNQALDINPNFALAYYYRGLAYLELKNQQKTIEDLRRAVELFEQEKDMDKYEEAQRILKAIQPDYSEPSFTEIYHNVRSKNLRIAKRTLRRYHLALKTRKFVILSGISGTGKTWLTKAYAQAVEAEYLLAPVAPNWTTNEDLLGYLSPIDNKYHDTDFSTFLEKAEEEYQQAQAEKRTPRPYHLVLDEMNLARVEYYFAKFLSTMEVRMREGVAQIQLASEKQVLLPPNLYFIGTVNIDETTHSFADKVYDRAQLIEIEAPRQELYEHLGEVPYREMLMQVWDKLHTVAPFAFRVLDEIKTYVKEAESLEVSWQDALDEQLLQKILPKLKGADDRVGVALKAFVDIVNDKEFPLSHKKATKMLATFNQHGFTSYF